MVLRHEAMVSSNAATGWKFELCVRYSQLTDEVPLQRPTTPVIRWLTSALRRLGRCQQIQSKQLAGLAHSLTLPIGHTAGSKNDVVGRTMVAKSWAVG